MRGIPTSFRLIAAVLPALLALCASAATPGELLAGFEAAARESTPEFRGLSAQRGELFFKTAHGNDWSCSTCHTENPLVQGKHAKTGKIIAPIAPAANPQRFTDAAKVDKWFRRNCNDVVGRACSAQEKGDFLSYLMSLK